jgi:phage replication O-like protein O
MARQEFFAIDKAASRTALSPRPCPSGAAKLLARRRSLASPQAENGHIDIANELAEAFQKLQLSGYQWRILWVILRQTWGWPKKIDRISLSMFEEKTKIPKRHVARALKELVDRKILSKNDQTYTTTYGLQKDYELWKAFPNLGTPKNGNSQNGAKVFPKLGTEVFPKLGTTKEMKEIIQKKPLSGPAFEQFYHAYPKKKARRSAERAWVKLNPPSALVQTILTALEKQKRSEEWKRENGKFIPYPATWLNDHRWEDVVEEKEESRWKK